MSGVEAARSRGARPPAARTQPPSPELAILPPSLTGNALRDELRASAQRHQEELAALARERARLEKLAAEIAKARAALEKETARLGEQVKKSEAAKAGDYLAQGRDGGKPPGEALAKTLKSMKPDQAAALVGRLDRRLAVILLRFMRPSDAGSVLEKMKPETAAELLSLMASGEAAGGSQ